VPRIVRAALVGALACGLAVPAAHAAAPPPGPPSSIAAIPGLPAPATAVSAASVAAASAQVSALEVAAAAAAGRLRIASARDLSLRIGYQRLEVERAGLAARFATQVRRAYENYQADPLSGLVLGLSMDGPVAANLAQRDTLAVDRSLLDQVSATSKELAAMGERLAAARAQLLAPALAAEASLGRAEALLGYESNLLDVAQAAALAAQRAQIAALSGQVTNFVALTASPEQLATAAAQQPILSALNAAGAGLPAGYAATGQVLTGIASWYGPGFIGNATSSGAPYDPAQLTCAMLAVPLDTVVHVSTGARAVNCLVNDRGPYVSGRIIDMSEAGAAALDYTGIAEVTVTVLAPAH
jgi:hypothetical protein